MSGSSADKAAQEIQTEFSEITRNDFDRIVDDFVFGIGTSAYQHEGGAAKGGRGQSIWDVFTLRTPGRIADGSNGNVAADMFSKYEEDIKRMKSMGFDAYRFSISWPRILPGGRLSLGVNKEGINFYNNIINTILANGIEPYVTLFHWDLPHSLEQEYGGFLSKNIVNDFREYAELCFWEFGDRVKNWITLNESWTYAFHGYVGCIFPPNTSTTPSPPSDNKTENVYSNGDSKTRKSDSAKDVYTVARNFLLAHAEAVQSYRTKFKDHQKGKIGITLVSHYFEPFTNGEKDTKAAKRALDFMLGCWIKNPTRGIRRLQYLSPRASPKILQNGGKLHFGGRFLEPVLRGSYPKNMIELVPKENLAPFSKEESTKLKGSIDFLGLNYYTTMYAADDPSTNGKHGYNEDQQVAVYTERNGKPIGPVPGSSWLYIVPWGIHKLLKYIDNTYNNTTFNLPVIYITENGVGVKNDHRLTADEACRDKIRVHYHQDHLGNILKAIKEDVNVKGYFAWSWCDNFEWTEGYTVRYGLMYVDYMNYLTRHPKDSAIWFAKFLVKKKALSVETESELSKSLKDVKV